ncbi:MAG: PAS domain S-box protein [Gammaproteobacteria bacterium]|nr:PAS domain S-box protein [Gammaproteobacteria bacterium]
MFRDLIEALPDALVVTGSDGNIIHVNVLAEEMFGYQHDEIVGQAVEMLMPERFRQAHCKSRDDYSRAPTIRPMNECTGFYGQHKEGHEFAIEIYLSPLRERGNVWGLAAIRDISARKKMEDELRCARDELELRVEARTIELARINESLRREMDERNRIAEQARQLNAELAHVSRLSILGEMTSGMAHELNQPLAAISNYSQGCVRRMRNDHVDLLSLIPALERVTAEASRAAEIIARFRQFARKEALQKQRVTMDELVHKAVDLERFEAEACGLQLHVELQAELPHVLVDEIQIQQVMVNLIRNAIEVTETAATAQQSVFVKVYRANDGENGNVVVAVEDSGHGFSEQLGQQIFQPFFTTKPEGLGMGLSISRSIIEAHGGRLWADSSEGSGATFFFSLPANEHE